MDQEILNKLTQEEKLTYSNFILQIENLQLKLFVVQYNLQEFISKMQNKYNKGGEKDE
jgi:hypothetical protein